MTASVSTAAERIMKLASDRRMTVATVESCTAGSLVHLLSQAPGAARTLDGGFVVYTKDNKTKAVGVPAEVIRRHTAVSPEVAKAMALGGLERSPAAMVVAITGVAGPDPDEDGNPIGLVFVAVATRNGYTRIEQHEFGNLTKTDICAKAMRAALSLMEDMLVDHR